MENKMNVTVVEVSDENLWNGAKVRNKRSQRIFEIRVIPADKTISQCVHEGTFVPNKNVDYETVMLNKHMFELIDEKI